MKLYTSVAALLSMVLVSTPVFAGALEDELERRLQGAWVVMLTEGYSNCAGGYNNNEVGAAGVTAKATRRFAPGELAKVDKINLKRSRLDLFLSFAEPVLTSRVDGPFTLYDEQPCKLQLLVGIPRQDVKSNSADIVMTRLGETVKVFHSQAEAEASDSWNQRQREPFPDDYDLTLARHAIWKAEQINATVVQKSKRALDDAGRIVDRLRDDPDYITGFGAGMESMRSQLAYSDCDDLLEMSFDWKKRSVPSDHDGNSSAERRWQDGWSDGQELVFSVILADRLRGCMVPVPPAPN
ncbi:MAG: hypothetical protein GY906_33405 [bacterium]|nr:hypothetical protein [bacterium]